MTDLLNIYLFVIWCPRDYVKNFTALCGWKSCGMRAGKKHRSGTEPFRAVSLRDLGQVASLALLQSYLAFVHIYGMSNGGCR